MAGDDSITCWINGMRAGDGEDIRRLWERYFDRIVRLAESRLPTHARRSFDEEDVALSAFHSVCERAGRGQFPDLTNRDDLWRLLVTITARKASNVLRHQGRQKRGGGKVFGESAVDAGGDDPGAGLARFLGREPTPEDAARFADEYARLFARLDDPSLRSIAVGKLEGYSSEEIAVELGVSSRTVDRKLGLIRALWAGEDGA